MKSEKLSVKKRTEHLIRMIPIFGLILSVLACEMGTTTQNIRIGELPQYVCPSATPRVTDTPQPTSLPTYPGYFTANLSNYQIGTNISSVTVQWLGQNAGNIYVSYSGSTTLSPYFWNGASNIYVGYSAPNQAAQNGFYTVVIPADVISATVQVWATNTGGVSTFSVYRVLGIVGQFFTAPGWGAPAPIYPTPRPTFTPYPTPTLYVRTNDYFIGDAIYTAPEEESLRVRFRLIEIRSLDAPAMPTLDYPTSTPNPRRTSTPAYNESLYIWTFRIKNVGSQEFNFYPAMQTYLSTITLPNGSDLNGVWGATRRAGEAAGIPLDGYALYSLSPNEEVEITLAAFAPQGSVERISWALDASSRPTPVADGQPTPIVAGSNIVSWINAVNTECVGEIAAP